MSTGNKTVIVTGVSNGIGFAIANACLKRGYNVVGHARTPERLRVAARPGTPDRFVFLVGDISKPATLRDCSTRRSRASVRSDILINNANVFVARWMVDYTNEDMENMVDTSLRGFIYPSRKAAKYMSATRHRHIVNITASGLIRPDINVPAFFPSRITGGIHHATRSLAVELAPHNVKVNAVAPALVNPSLQATGTLDSFKGLPSRDPIGTVEQIVDAVLYLTESEFVTGMVIPADGVPLPEPVVEV